MIDEFYSVAFRKKHYESIEALQVDLDNFMDYYNYRQQPGIQTKEEWL